MDNFTNHWFGLPIPEGVEPVRAWGARAILRNDPAKKPVKKKGRIVGYDTTIVVTFDVLHDRQTYRGPDITKPEAKAFFRWIDTVGLATLGKMADKTGLAPSDDIELPVDDGKYHLRANPRRSYGYLYIVAWEDDHGS